MKQTDKPAAHKILSLLLETGKLDTIRSQFKRVKGGDDGRIRTVLSPGGTETGRFSSSSTFLEASTNLQNIAKGASLYNPLYDVRSVFIADPGRTLCAVDLSQAEARVAAYAAGDELAMQQIEDGVNRYVFLAEHHYGYAIDKTVHKAEYAVGKQGLLSFQYDGSWKTFKDNVNERADLTGATVTAAEAKRFERMFHELYPGYRRNRLRVKQRLERDGFLVDPSGRRRDFYGRQDSAAAREAVLREAIAFATGQATVAYVLNSGLARLYYEYDPALLRILLQVHDEIVYDCAEGQEMRVAKLVKRVLETSFVVNGHEIVIPAEVSMTKTNWSEMEEIL